MGWELGARFSPVFRLLIPRRRPLALTDPCHRRPGVQELTTRVPRVQGLGGLSLVWATGAGVVACTAAEAWGPPMAMCPNAAEEYIMARIQEVLCEDFLVLLL